MKYVILEIIPSTYKRETGNILQIQALKLNELKLIDRFDYRLDIPLNNPDLLNILSYDKDKFTYVKDEKELLKNFKDFISDLPLLIIDNPYTLDYLKDINNPKESVFKHLNLEYSQDVFDKIINKYNLEPSNHLVDLLYEALIYESNN